MTPIRLPSPVRLPDGATSDLGAPSPNRFQRYDRALAHSAERRVDAPTPTINTDLVFKRGGFAGLCDALDYAAHGDTGLNFFDARGKLLSSLPYRDLQVQAFEKGRRYRAYYMQSTLPVILSAEPLDS